MGIKNCPECGKVFSAVSGDICPDCQKVEDEEYEKVSKFLKEHPLSSIDKVSVETGVSRRKVIKFLKKGEITGVEVPEELKFRCVSCDTPIPSGKLCPKCAKELSEKLSLEKKKIPKKDAIPEKRKGELYIAERIKKKLEGK